jgi:hypothetical protein
MNNFLSRTLAETDPIISAAIDNEARRMFALAKEFEASRAPAGLSEDETRRFVFKELYGFEMPGRE